ncbi:MAG: Ppx/GppA family phosphatase [Leptolyngbya sp. SIO4C1]|nr:Ppx/GppA family phosphatase [Leptolyngbya sp. SIO4C1]
MKLAAIDIGTNSIHMIVVQVLPGHAFEVIEREKEMVKLGAGVFSTKQLSPQTFDYGLETIKRYVHLADQLGVDEIITAATSAIREAHNGEAFLSAVSKQAGISPRIISGKEEARLIFLAVRNAIALADETALVLDIGGGSTEAVVGNTADIFFGTSLPLGVQRLRDMFENQQPLAPEGRSAVEAYIQYQASESLETARDLGFDRVIGTSGTIRTLGEAAHLANGQSLRSVNAEVAKLSDIDQVTKKLLKLDQDDRTKVDGVSEKRTDAIHLGGILLVQLLRLAQVKEITLCDASLREGMILDYLERHGQDVTMPEFEDLRHRSAAQLVSKYGADWSENSHVAHLALQLFDQTRSLHDYGEFERELLEYGALLHDIGQYISFRKYHKNSRYIIKQANPRGFNDEEVMLIGHLARYHCKAAPTKGHKKFKKLDKSQRRIVRLLSGILRIAVGLNKTKNQQIDALDCDISAEALKIAVQGSGSLALELWAARRERQVLEAALKREILIVAQT